LEGVLGTLRQDGYSDALLTPVENKTVVTEPWAGARDNRWLPVLDRFGLKFQPLTEVSWMVYRFKSPLLRLNQIFPEGIEIPSIYPGRNILHLPTVKTHGHSTTTGSIKNAFGGLLKEVRHYAHKYIHEVLVDLVQGSEGRAERAREERGPGARDSPCFEGHLPEDAQDVVDREMEEVPYPRAQLERVSEDVVAPSGDGAEAEEKRPSSQPPYDVPDSVHRA
jgi:hypothetical protein